MSSYGNSLIAVMVICQISSVIAPNSEYSKRYIRIVCALVTLLTILAPVRHMTEIYGTISDKISAFFASDITEQYDDNEICAVGLMQYITEQYDISDVSVVIRTDESDTEIVEIQIYIPSCPYTKRASIEADLNAQLDIPVGVFCK